MVARTWSIDERFVPAPQEFVDGRWRLPRFTRRDAEALVRLGIIPEDASTELLHGLIVLKDRAAWGEEPTRAGNGHTVVVERLSDLRGRINNAGRHVRSQQPLVCSETHVPEPDFMVLRGGLKDYTDLPMAADAYCVVEVADASYERDAGEKLAGYARAGVVDLRNWTAEVYEGANREAGTYGPARVVGEAEVVGLGVGEQEVVEVRVGDVLP